MASAGTPEAGAFAQAQGAAPEAGIDFYPDDDPGQCRGLRRQWNLAPDWTAPVRLDTDSRPGG
ncbi:hypothetical protein [Streptomyces sp. NPDC090445]|uniref:hypothetical protein n=1 Tax=Streptomyces sp. NPDC090445 TaxID=3365963 RepID=UPI00381BB2DF